MKRCNVFSILFIFCFFSVSAQDIKAEINKLKTSIQSLDYVEYDSREDDCFCGPDEDIYSYAIVNRKFVVQHSKYDADSEVTTKLKTVSYSLDKLTKVNVRPSPEGGSQIRLTFLIDGVHPEYVLLGAYVLNKKKTPDVKQVDVNNAYNALKAIAGYNVK